MTALIATYAPNGTSDKQWLGREGMVIKPIWSTKLPGGDEQLSCTLLTSTETRPEAIKLGRQIAVYDGGLVWWGQLDQPARVQDGWELTAHGRGTFGTQFRDYWTSWTGANPVDQAITRGLGWVNGGISGVDTSQKHDPAAGTITEHLDAIVPSVTKTWKVDRDGALSVISLPTTVTRLLVLAGPATRDVAGYVTRIWIRYQDKTDHYAVTSVVKQSVADEFGTLEDYWDFGDAGVMTSGAAQTKANGILDKYTAASWEGPFVASYGQYLTTGGVPVHLPSERSGEVVKLIFAGAASGGEPIGLTPTFIVARTVWDQDLGLIQVEPMQSVRHSLSDLLSASLKK